MTGNNDQSNWMHPVVKMFWMKKSHLFEKSSHQNRTQSDVMQRYIDEAFGIRMSSIYLAIISSSAGELGVSI